MSAAAINLTTSQANNPLVAGNNNVTFNYTGVVDTAADNPVQIVATINPASGLKFSNGTNKLSYSQSFPVGNPGALSKAAVIVAPTSSPVGNIATITFKFTGAQGDFLTQFTSVIY